MVDDGVVDFVCGLADCLGSGLVPGFNIIIIIIILWVTGYPT